MPDVSAEERSYLTAREVAALFGVSLRTVDRMQSDGMLTPVYLPRNRRRFVESAVRELAAGKLAAATVRDGAA